MADYLTLNEAKNELGISTDETDANRQLIAMIAAASAAIDKWCHREFFATSETRYFDGGGTILFIDDLISVTTLKVDSDGDGTFEDAYTENSDFYLYPLNETPKTYAVIAPNGDYGSFGGARRRAVEIAGSWGYAATVPGPVRRACMMLVAAMYEQRKTGGMKSERIGDYSYQVADSIIESGMIKELLIPYHKLRIL